MDIKTNNVIDLFCGCGGLSLGFQNAGYNIVAAFDYWDVALNIYQKNFQHPVYKRDLSDLTEILSSVDLLVRIILRQVIVMRHVEELLSQFLMRK